MNMSPNSGSQQSNRQVILSANSSYVANPLPMSKRTILYVIDGILITAILFVAIFILPDAGKVSKAVTTNPPASSTTTDELPSVSNQSNSTSLNPTNNPLNSGGSINSEVQYCSNVINAELAC